MPRISTERYGEALKIDPGKNRGKFWVREGEIYWDRFKVPTADAKSFVPLNEIWGRDKQHVYCTHGRIPGADPKTFRVLNTLFAKDTKRVYCVHGVCTKCDAATFEVLDDGRTLCLPDMDDAFCGYARDRANIFYHESDYGNARALQGANRDAFRVMKFGYATDGARIWAYGKRVAGANTKSFKILGRFYARDDVHAFYREFEIKDADVNSFQVIADISAKDANRTYERQWTQGK